MLLRDVEGKLLLMHGGSPDKSYPRTLLAVAQDFHRLFLHPPRGLGSRTFEILQIPLRVVEVENRTRAGGPTIWLDPVEREYLPLYVRLNPDREAFGLRVSYERGPGCIHFPGPERRLGPDRGAKQQRQQNGSHAATMGETVSKNKKEQVVKRCYTFRIAMKIGGILEVVAAREIQSEVVQSHLQRVLASPGFARNDRMSRFLRFIVERQLHGRVSELKESLIGIEVFGRKPGFDPQQDSTVRSEAARLRARLAEYYAGEGRHDTLIIELPKGGYTPRFVQPEAPLKATNEERPARSGSRLLVVLAGLAVASAAVGYWWLQHQSAPIAIAVLPLTNLSQDSANDYFADGLTDEIIRNLSIIDGLVVRSRTSSFAFKGNPPKVREQESSLAPITSWKVPFCVRDSNYGSTPN
jgi:hypothetical protein